MRTSGSGVLDFLHQLLTSNGLRSINGGVMDGADVVRLIPIRLRWKRKKGQLHEVTERAVSDLLTMLGTTPSYRYDAADSGMGHSTLDATRIVPVLLASALAHSLP